MSTVTAIQIVGAPVACADGVKDTWRDLAGWLAGKLRAQYGTAVSVTYYDLFDPGCPTLPPDTQLPLVLVTSLESREHMERGVEVGANAYITKSSFDQSNLLETVERLI